MESGCETDRKVFTRDRSLRYEREKERKKSRKKKIARASIGPPGLSREITRRTCARMANSEKVALSRR